MKKVLLIAAIALFGFNAAQAQEKSNAIKANPLSLLGGTDLISYERALGEKSTIVIGAGIGGFKIAGTKYKNTGASLQYRYYFTEAIIGWYAGAIAQYSTGKVESDGGASFFGDIDGVETVASESNFNAFGAGAKIGHQWSWDSGFTLDLNLGASYASFSYEDDNTFTSGLKASGVVPTFAFALGYAW